MALEGMSEFREFIVFAKYLNITRAAEELHVSTSTLSRHIAALEHEIGMPLVRREGSASSLTPVGSLVLKKASTLVGEYDSLLEQVARYRADASYSLRVAYALDDRTIIDAISLAKLRMKQTYTGLNVQPFHGRGQSGWDALRAGEVDVCIDYSLSPETLADDTYVAVPLMDDSIVLALPKGTFPDVAFLAPAVLRLREQHPAQLPGKLRDSRARRLRPRVSPLRHLRRRQPQPPRGAVCGGTRAGRSREGVGRGPQGRKRNDRGWVVFVPGRTGLRRRRASQVPRAVSWVAVNRKVLRLSRTAKLCGRALTPPPASKNAKSLRYNSDAFATPKRARHLPGTMRTADMAKQGSTALCQIITQTFDLFARAPRPRPLARGRRQYLSIRSMSSCLEWTSVFS